MEFGRMARQLEWIWNALLLAEQLPCADSVVKLRNVSWVLIGVGTGCGRCVEEFVRERRSEPSERNISKNQL
jgi:hypothetical protein